MSTWYEGSPTTTPADSACVMHSLPPVANVQRKRGHRPHLSLSLRGRRRCGGWSSRRRRGSSGCGRRQRTCSNGVPPSPPSTKWTRRVPHPVLIGHAASFTPYKSDTPRPSPRTNRTRRGTGSAARQVILPCKHVFHRPCVLRWMNQRRAAGGAPADCPVCRSPIA